MRNSSEVCRTFREHAIRVWNEMGDAFSLSIGLNEETITETLLLKLAQQFRGRGIEVKSFTKHEEGTSYKRGAPTGADWEWRFEGPNGLGKTVRVQAKRLYMREGNYGALDGNGKQRKLLAAACGNAIPIYILYNGPSSALVSVGRERAFPWLNRHDPQFCCWPYYDLPLWGCAISAEPDLPNINKPQPSDFPKMEPWHVLVCNCRQTNQDDLGVTVSKNLAQIYGARPASVPPRLNFSPDGERPWWASELLETGDLEELPGGLQGVAVFRQTS